jgi:hypothetical protein
LCSHYSQNLTFQANYGIELGFKKDGNIEVHAVVANELALCYHNLKHSLV